MKKRFATSIGIALFVVLAAGASPAQTLDASNGVSWLDGFSLVELEGDDIAGLHRARAEIQSHGGRVAIMSPPSLILGWVPYEIRAELIGRAGIKAIHYTEVLPGEVDALDPQSNYMIEYYNSVVRGDVQKKLFERSSSNATDDAREWPAGVQDALPRPDVDPGTYLENLTAAGLDIKQLKDHGMLLQSAQAPSGNSDAMTGTISVTLFLVESNGAIDPNLYTWTDEHVQEYVNGVNTGLAWWTTQAYNYWDCWNAFLVRYFPPTDPRCQQGYEPVNHTGGFHSTWASLVMSNFGYTSGNIWSKAEAYNTYQRVTYGTDRAYSAFIAYNPPGTPDRFTDASPTAAFAYLGGPHTVLLYRSFTWDPEEVFTHETGHIFWACDEYEGSGCSCTVCAPSRPTGNRPNTNCYLCSSFHCMMKGNEFVLCTWTPAQIGWEGTGCAPAPLAPPAPTGVNPLDGLQGVRTTITLSGSGFVWGAAVDMGPYVTVHGATVINSSTLDVDMTPETDAPLGLVDIAVTNRDFQTDTLNNAFNILQTVHHYASPAGNNIFPYITPTNAAISFGDALAAAGGGDTILVQTGVYPENDSLVISHGFTLLGAWNSGFSVRDLVSGKSSIDLSFADSKSILVESGGAPVVIDGFIITDGDGSLQPSPPFPIAGKYGGAIYVKDTPVTVSNCVMSSNTAGTGGNYGAGGAFYASGSVVDFHDNEVHSNSAGQGGAVFLLNCTGTLSNNNIHSNEVVLNTEPADGGGVFVDSSVVSISGGEISHNTADNAGGGIFYNAADLTVDGVRILRNTSGFGGGIGTPLTGSPSIMITDCEISWNTGAIGGGVQLTGNASVEHNLFVGNNGTSFGGAGYLSAIPTGGFINNTLDRNTSSNTGGVFIAASIPVTNNIIVNSGSVGLGCSGATTAYNNVWNSAAADYSGCTPGAGSISADPLFADTTAGDYHLAIHSPCIDAGDPNSSYDDPDGSRGDMGVYGSNSNMDQPSYPKDLRLRLSAGDVILRWDPNPEPDVAWYAVYEDTMDGFIPSGDNFVQLVAAPNTSFNAGTFADTSFYRIVTIDTDGYASGHSNTTAASLITGIDDVASYSFQLYQNHPNPFNPTTTIRYEVNERVHVTLTVFDVQGRVVQRLVDTAREPGVYSVQWNGRNSNGENVSSGIYFYRLQAGSEVQTKKMVMLK